MDQGKLIYAAPAKVNLHLRIEGRRDDGFHELETAIVPLDLTDSLTFEPVPATNKSQVELTCSDPRIACDETNLVRRALTAFREVTGFPLPAMRIHLEKNIPSGAGLGGGSSNAAAALKAANHLNGNRLEVDDLTDIAARVGSDVPFFLFDAPAWCRGRGEIVDPASFSDRVSSLPMLLIKPPFAVATPWAYRSYANGATLSGFPREPQRTTGLDLELINDLEPPVFGKFITLASLRTWLRDRPEVNAALMSGSGSTVFAVLNDLKDATTLIENLRQNFGGSYWFRKVRAAMRAHTQRPS